MFHDKEDEDAEREVSAKEQVFKIIIIGDSGVGKTCLAHRFSTGTFPERTEATIGVDFWERSLTINGSSVRVSWNAYSSRSSCGSLCLWINSFLKSLLQFTSISCTWNVASWFLSCSVFLDKVSGYMHALTQETIHLVQLLIRREWIDLATWINQLFL